MESLDVSMSFWRNKRILITGHTGFKGGWLSQWLSDLGGDVVGYSLDPGDAHSFYQQTNLASIISKSFYGDVRDMDSLAKVLLDTQPEFVFHMAAQPLVRKSYNCPIETFSTNVMGTINLLEAIRKTASVRVVVNVTSDKCYENQEWVWPYRETDKLGGHDPYSASKACAEIASNAYMKSFLTNSGVLLANVRAGNVVGGGDWSKDRLVPDIFSCNKQAKLLSIRSPNARRPWQHVLEPICGYIMLAEKLYEDGAAYTGAWNFGPDEKDSKTVKWIVEQLAVKLSNLSFEFNADSDLHEAKALMIDSSKAKLYLGWKPKWDIKTALSKTLDWHLAWEEKFDMQEITKKQIAEYQSFCQNLE